MCAHDVYISFSFNSSLYSQSMGGRGEAKAYMAMIYVLLKTIKVNLMLSKAIFNNKTYMYITNTVKTIDN